MIDILARRAKPVLLGACIMGLQNAVASERCVELSVLGTKLYIRESLIAFVHDGGTNQADTIVALSIPASLLKVQLSPAFANKPRHTIAASIQLESDDAARLSDLEAVSHDIHSTKDEEFSSSLLPSGSVIMIPKRSDQLPYIICQPKLGEILGGGPQLCDADQDIQPMQHKTGSGAKSMTIKYGFLSDDIKNIAIISKSILTLVRGFSQGCVI